MTTNKVRFHIDYCEKAIPDILATPCIRDKTVLHIGEAAKISTVSVAGAQIAKDNRIFFGRDPVAMDRIGLDILEAKREERRLGSVRAISTHVAACAKRGLGTDDLARIELRASMKKGGKCASVDGVRFGARVQLVRTNSVKLLKHVASEFEKLRRLRSSDTLHRNGNYHLCFVFLGCACI